MLTERPSAFQLNLSEISLFNGSNKLPSAQADKGL